MINLKLGLKFLVRICTDLGLKDIQEYAQKLMKAEKAKELKEQVGALSFLFVPHCFLFLT